MEVIERRLKKFGFETRPFNVYTSKEAEEEGVEFKYWKSCRPGDWGVTDDEWVTECLDEYKSKNTTQLVFSCGRVWVNERSKFEFAPRLRTGNFYGTSTDTWQEQEMKRTRTKRAVTAYAHMFLSGKPVDWNFIGEIYRPDQQRPDLTVRRLFKEKEIERLIDKKIRELGDERGITEDTAFEWIEKAAEMAKEKKDPSNLMRAAENLIKIFGMEPKKQIMTDTMEIDLSRQIEGTIEKEQARLVAKKEKEGYVEELASDNEGS